MKMFLNLKSDVFEPLVVSGLSTSESGRILCASYIDPLMTTDFFTFQFVPSFCEDQLLLVNLVSNIKVMPIDTLVQTVKQVIKTPPPTSQDRNKVRTGPFFRDISLELSGPEQSSGAIPNFNFSFSIQKQWE